MEVHPIRILIRDIRAIRGLDPALEIPGPGEFDEQHGIDRALPGTAGVA